MVVHDEPQPGNREQLLSITMKGVLLISSMLVGGNDQKIVCKTMSAVVPWKQCWNILLIAKCVQDWPRECLQKIKKLIEWKFAGTCWTNMN